MAARAFERDRYLSALLAPVDARPGLIAIAAFAGEVARIPATVSEPMIGAIRLQWWRDQVEAMGGAHTASMGRAGGVKSGHPIADALAQAVSPHRQPVGLLTAYIDAQDLGLGAEPPEDDHALAQHLIKTEGALFELALNVLGGAAAVERARPLLGDAARAYGLTRLLVELPAFTAEGRTLLPASRLAAAGLTAEALYARGDAVEMAVAPVARHIADEARRHLALAVRQFRTSPTGRERLALLPLATVVPTLRAVNGMAAQALSCPADILPLTRIMRLSWTYMTGRL